MKPNGTPNRGVSCALETVEAVSTLAEEDIEVLRSALDKRRCIEAQKRNLPSGF